MHVSYLVVCVWTCVQTIVPYATLIFIVRHMRWNILSSWVENLFIKKKKDKDADVQHDP